MRESIPHCPERQQPFANMSVATVCFFLGRVVSRKRASSSYGSSRSCPNVADRVHPEGIFSVLPRNDVCPISRVCAARYSNPCLHAMPAVNKAGLCHLRNLQSLPFGGGRLLFLFCFCSSCVLFSKVEVMKCDISDLESVRDLAASLTAPSMPPVDVIIANAGCRTLEQTTNKEVRIRNTQ